MSNTYRTEFWITKLATALEAHFNYVVEMDREQALPDFADTWVSIVAAALNDQTLTANPIIDVTQGYMPFLAPHRVKAEAFFALQSGMRGGTAIDVLVQLWFDTEEMRGGYGIPLIFSKVKHAGRMPEIVWQDLQDTCRELTRITPSGRVVFVAEERDFQCYGQYVSPMREAILVLDAHSFAGALLPLSPVRGRRLEAFCVDIASGWIGDPALSGNPPSAILDQFLETFHIGNVLRISIYCESPDRPPRQSRFDL